MERLQGRLSRFFGLENHALRAREFSALSSPERDFAVAFIVANAELDFDQYVLKLNRLPTITDSRVRPNRRTVIWGLLLEAATAEGPKKRRRE